MGKFREMIVVYSDSENSCDSLQLIDPVNNLSLENIEKNKYEEEDYDDQSNKLKKLNLNEKIKKRKTRFRHHPYIQPNKSKTKIQNNKRDECDMKFLKSLGYIKYSSSKKKPTKDIEQLFIQINKSIKSTFSKYLKSNDQPNKTIYICNRRFN